MRILITNNRLDLRGGADNYVRDLARALQQLGHSVMAYSSDLRQHDRLLDEDQIPVTTDVENLPFKPDIIHAQHHLDAMSALTALPDVPAIYQCHGAVWREKPPKHPCIYHYLAVSLTLSERIAIESNISPDNITTLPNSVDLQKFHQIRELPARPAKALFYNRYHGPESPTLLAIREATQRCGLSLDVVGYHRGNTTSEPQKLLPQYDIVFASGRSAIEAISSGCAVIVLGRSSCGPMVNRENYSKFRGVNFALPQNTPPVTAAEIETAIRQYDIDASREVTAQLRHDADSVRAAMKLVEIYESAIKRHRASPPSAHEQLAATSRYLRILVPLIKMTDALQYSDGLQVTKVRALHELRESMDQFQHHWRHV